MFQSDAFYLNILNTDEKPVQGSILSRAENIDAQYWYLVTSLNPLTLFIPKLNQELEIPQSVEPRSFIKMRVNLHLIATQAIKKAKKKQASRKPSKKVNYAVSVIKR